MYKYPAWKVFMFMLDIALMSLLYFMVGLTFSSWFNDQVIIPLNRGKGNLFIFIQCMGEIMLTVLAIYFILHFLPKVPSIVSDPPNEHLLFRVRGGDVLLAFSIVAAQLLYLDKLRFLYNEVKDMEGVAVVGILENWAICQDGSIAPVGEFSCQP